jgi:hypothetical protein
MVQDSSTRKYKVHTAVYITHQVTPLYALSLSAFSHVYNFMQLSQGASTSYPQPRYKLPRRVTELRAQFHSRALPFWLQGLQIKAPHGGSVRKPTCILYIPIIRVLGIRGDSKVCNTPPPHITSHLTSFVKYVVPVRLDCFIYYEQEFWIKV